MAGMSSKGAQHASIISSSCTKTLSFTIISWAAIDSYFTAVSWFTSSTTAKEAKIGVEIVASIL